ncbi:MAG TPA: hemolysin family protein [Acidimicrobiales bacterium]|nr:hemolysin family protein [Acidimicrobiales bacterium]
MFRRRSRRAGSEAGDQDPSPAEREILDALTALRDTTVREVMTPRVDVVALAAPVTVMDVVGAVRQSGHSRFPVYEGDLDQLVGVLFIKDLFRYGEPIIFDRDAPVRQVRRPYLVPEGRHVLEVLSEMRQQRNAFAVVVDEYGGFEGVLTIKDLVSELVGELPDEFDRNGDSPIVRVDAGRWLVAGDCPVDEINQELGAGVPEGEYVTLGGFLFDRFGHIPDEGEALIHDGWEFRIAEMDRRRIAKVVVKAPPDSPTA